MRGELRYFRTIVMHLCSIDDVSDTPAENTSTALKDDAYRLPFERVLVSDLMFDLDGRTEFYIVVTVLTIAQPRP